MARTTIADIAAELGVSVPTVSKVLNGRPDVAVSTRERVEDALRRHSYRRRGGPSPAVQNSSSLIELVINSVKTPWSLELIQGVQEVASEANLGVVLTHFSGTHEATNEWIEGVLARRPIGVILVLTTLEKEQRHQLDSRALPYVMVDTFGEPPADVATVGSNNWHGGLVATRHLIELGHTDIGVISGPRSYLCSRARVDGFRSAHEEAGLDFNPDMIKWGNFELDGGYDNGMELLLREHRPTAIFAGSDYQALGVMRAARKLHLDIPKDLSIVGYDNLPVSQWISPELTTVNQPLREMAATATRMLVNGNDGIVGIPSRIDLSTELVKRDSSGPPPAEVRPGVA